LQNPLECYNGGFNIGHLCWVTYSCHQNND